MLVAGTVDATHVAGIAAVRQPSQTHHKQETLNLHPTTKAPNPPP